jgi:predicted PurR-regulated permease PerM
VAVAFAGGLIMLAGQAQQWLAEAPKTVEQVGQMLPKKLGPLEHLQRTSAAVEDITEDKNAEKPLPVTVQSSETATTILGVSGHFLGASVIVFVVGYFLLAFSDTLLKQTIGLRSRFDEKRNIVELLRNVEGGISRYLLTITAINVGLGVVTALTMWALGLPNYILWGVMAATLNYVPHVGAMICMVVMFFVGAVSHQSLGYGAAVAGVFMLLTAAESYFITPLVLSKSLQLSPLAVILAILFGGWMWGIGGALMAAPLITIVKLVCDQFESLHSWAAFLAGDGSTNGGQATAG